MELHHLKKPAMYAHHNKEDSDVNIFSDRLKNDPMDERTKTVILLCSFIIVLVMLLIILMKVYN